jgi:SAM-dependent methyltransferase
MTDKTKYTAPNPAPLSGLLSKIRHAETRSKLPQGFKPQAMLDIGCGVYPRLMIDFGPEYGVGIDVRPKPVGFPAKFEYLQQDFNENPELKFPDETFDFVSALAVLEHIEPESLVVLLQEMRRVLKTGGHLIATVPSGYGDQVMLFLSLFGLTSRKNLQEHKDRYSIEKLKKMFLDAGFAADELIVEHFGLGIHICVKAKKN